MTYSPRILALDLASRTGWAYGDCGDARPLSGSVRFAKQGASLGAIYAGCRQWLVDFTADEPDNALLLVFEAPMAPQHMAGFTTAHIIRLLIGLCAIVEEFGHAGGYDVREARISSISRTLGTWPPRVFRICQSSRRRSSR